MYHDFLGREIEDLEMDNMRADAAEDNAMSKIMDLSWEAIQAEITSIEKAIELIGEKCLTNKVLTRLAVLKRVGQSSPMYDVSGPDYEPAEDNWEV